MKPLSPATHQSVAELTQLLILDGLSKLNNLTLNELVFQGGTSLSLAWKSPRFSEDLDFIAKKDLDFESIMKKVSKTVEFGLQVDYPRAKVEIKSKVKDNNPNAMFETKVELPETLGKVIVKSEFWRVSNEKIQDYQGETVFLAARGKIHPHLAPALGVASPSQILADKVLALGLRERLKWRDLFDIWFIQNQMKEKLDPSEYLAGKVLKTLKMYNADESTLIENLKEFVEIPHEDILNKAEEGLKQWLPEHLWQHLWPDKVNE
jgi:predicted nucleotidyltransferase component of viral defense system